MGQSPTWIFLCVILYLCVVVFCMFPKQWTGWVGGWGQANLIFSDVFIVFNLTRPLSDLTVNETDTHRVRWSAVVSTDHSTL